MDQIGFAERLAYVRWLMNRGRTDPVTDRELAERFGVGLKWLGKWKSQRRAPPGRVEAMRIGEAVAPWGVDISWLYDGEGTPPEPDLWKGWVAAREGWPDSEVPSPRLGPSIIQEPDDEIFEAPTLPEKKPVTKKRRA